MSELEVEILRRKLEREEQARVLSEQIANTHIDNLRRQGCLSSSQKPSDLSKFFLKLIDENEWSIIAIELSESSDPVTSDVVETINKKLACSFRTTERDMIVTRQRELFIAVRTVNCGQIRSFCNVLRRAILRNTYLHKNERIYCYASIVYSSNTYRCTFSLLITKLMKALEVIDNKGGNLVLSIDDDANTMEGRGYIAFPAHIYNAIINSEFEYVFQPIVDASSGCVLSYEALLRPKFSMSQVEFILGVQNLLHGPDRLECKKLLLERLSLDARRANLDRKAIAINCDVFELLDHDLFDEIFQFCSAMFASGQEIIVELLEGPWDQKHSISDLNDKLQSLKTLGSKIALDDFGTFDSNFYRLIMLEINYIKIDRSIVARIVSDPKSKKIMLSTKLLCDDLGLAIVAEGVETERQSKELINIGIVQQQGFLFLGNENQTSQNIISH